MIKPIPKKYTSDQIPLLVKARMDKWLCRIQQMGDKVFLDCLPPNEIKFVTIECANHPLSINEAVEEFSRTEPAFKYVKAYDIPDWHIFTDAFFARQDLLREEDA